MFLVWAKWLMALLAKIRKLALLGEDEEISSGDDGWS